ncbi:hypothetical protein [Flavimarina sp. Hel_I_48]|uniref:hypothetical protein n=1 Tax=Flavimarina sp. Hel_I_48 TaxID=1392488 RepID=UPI00068F21A5|nr:hypothetical protein [Flavimarina sp. Hel_I_48]
MKQSLILFALMIVFKPVFPVVEYVFDYEYISEVLCINKDKPELHCNGKCYLMQSLAEVAKEEAAQKKQDLLKKVDVPLLFIETMERTVAADAKISEQRIIYSLPSCYTFQETSNVFHPPIV